MDKTTLCRKLKEDKLTLDDLRGIPYEMSKEEIADLLVEMYYAFCVEMGTPENNYDGTHNTNRAILSCLLERWWYELEDMD